MSRSYRKPAFSYVSGTSSDKPDRDLASRLWRRKMNQSLHSQFANSEDWDSYLIPDKYEASFNNRWVWHSDGEKHLQFFPDRWDLRWQAEFGDEEFEKRRQEFLRLHRK